MRIINLIALLIILSVMAIAISSCSGSCACTKIVGATTLLGVSPVPEGAGVYYEVCGEWKSYWPGCGADGVPQGWWHFSSPRPCIDKKYLSSTVDWCRTPTLRVGIRLSAAQKEAYELADRYGTPIDSEYRLGEISLCPLYDVPVTFSPEEEECISAWNSQCLEGFFYTKDDIWFREITAEEKHLEDGYVLVELSGFGESPIGLYLLWYGNDSVFLRDKSTI